MTRTRVAKFNITNAVLAVCTGAMAVTRLLFKRAFSSSHSFSADDWVVLATLFVGLPSVLILSLGLAANGLGRDVWALDGDGTLVDFAFYFFLSEILYIALMAMIKLAFSLFYLTIFPGKRVRRLLWVTVAVQLAFGLAFVVKDAVQCLPPDWYWKRMVDDSGRQGRCINVHVSGWVNGVAGVVIDLWLLAIPLVQIRKLKLHWKKKVGVGIMFVVGTVWNGDFLSRKW